MKTVIRTMRVKLYFNKEQLKLLEDWSNTARWIYNQVLSICLDKIDNTGKTHTKFDTISLASVFNKQANVQLPSQAAQQVGVRVFNTMKRYEKEGYKKDSKKYRPKFRSWKRGFFGLTYPQHVEILEDISKVKLPKLGRIRVRGIRKGYITNVRTATIVSEGIFNKKYFLCITGDSYVNEKEAYGSVGIDVGVTDFITDSNGARVEPVDLTKHNEKIKEFATKLSSHQKGSMSFLKTLEKLKMWYMKRTRTLISFAHKVSNYYTQFKVVVFEDLRIKNMTKKATGTVENPNPNSSAKRALNRKIMSMAWGRFFTILKYKLDDCGSLAMRVDSKYTSQTCSNCGVVNKENRDGKLYSCNQCGIVIDADHNAAINILRKGMDVIAFLGDKPVVKVNTV